MSNANEGENMRLFYQVFIDDIRYSKRQQWNTIYLTLLAIAGILALLLGLGLKLGQVISQWPLQCCLSFRWFLGIICSGISGLGIFYIWIYYGDIGRYRKVKDQLKNELEKNVPLHIKRCIEENKGKFKELYFVIPFCIVIGLAWFLCICLIWTIN